MINRKNLKKENEDNSSPIISCSFAMPESEANSCRIESMKNGDRGRPFKSQQRTKQETLAPEDFLYTKRTFSCIISEHTVLFKDFLQIIYQRVRKIHGCISHRLRNGQYAAPHLDCLSGLPSQTRSCAHGSFDRPQTLRKHCT